MTMRHFMVGVFSGPTIRMVPVKVQSAAPFPDPDLSLTREIIRIAEDRASAFGNPIPNDATLTLEEAL